MMMMMIHFKSQFEGLSMIIVDGVWKNSLIWTVWKEKTTKVWHHGYMMFIYLFLFVILGFSKSKTWFSHEIQPNSRLHWQRDPSLGISETEVEEQEQTSIQDMFVYNGQHINGYLFKTKFVVNLLAYVYTCDVCLKKSTYIVIARSQQHPQKILIIHTSWYVLYIHICRNCIL